MKHYITSVLLAALTVAAALSFTACSDDNDAGEAFFTVYDGSNAVDSYNFDYTAADTTVWNKAKTLVVRSNRPWKLVPQDENGWLRVFPAEGEGDGLIRLSRTLNNKPDTRTLTYKIYLDGKDSGKTFTVTQTGAEPYLKGSATSFTIARTGGENQFTVITNVPYEYSLKGKDTSWLTVTRSTDDENVLLLTAGENLSGDDRTITLHLQGTGNYAALTLDIPVTQLSTIFFDNFAWMGINGIDTRAGLSILGWDTNGESGARFDKWTDDELAHGWVSRSTTCYMRPGFFKLGKTSSGGDIVSPKIDEIAGTMDITVSFQAVGYSSAKGALDDKVLYVGLLGPGKIVGVKGAGTADLNQSCSYVDADGTTPLTLTGCACITLTSDNNFNPTTDPDGLLIWNKPVTKYSVLIAGATSETQVVMIGGAFGTALKTIGQGKNRVFIDNFTVRAGLASND